MTSRSRLRPSSAARPRARASSAWWGARPVSTRLRMMRWKAWSIRRVSGMRFSLRIGQDGDGRDLDERALAQEAGHDDAGRGREAALEELAAHLGGLAVVLGGGDVLGGLHDVLEAAARRGQEPGELLEDVARLGR